MHDLASASDVQAIWATSTLAPCAAQIEVKCFDNRSTANSKADIAALDVVPLDSFAGTDRVLGDSAVVWSSREVLAEETLRAEGFAETALASRTGWFGIDGTVSEAGS